MGKRWAFDGGEIEFVANNMDCHTREYVVAARRAAMRRARNKMWPEEARERMRTASDAMRVALKEWPKGKFDSALAPDDASY